MSGKKASIIILTRNGEQTIGECLKMVYAQAYTDFEVIVIDSASTDETADIVAGFPVRLHTIREKDFGHGKTRNLGAELAGGDYLVYLTQDAIPHDEHWLGNLIKSAKGEEIAGSYSRNIPRHDCDPFEARYISAAWGEKKEIKNIKNYKNFKKLVFFSNTSSCIKKDVWVKYPFNEQLVQTEDQDWSKRVLEAGYTIVYEPSSIVVHSHSLPVKKLFKKYFDAGAAHKLVFHNNNNVYLPLIPFFAIAVTLLDLNFMLKKNYRIRSILKWAPSGIIRHVFEATGFWFGLHSEMLSRNIRKKFTMYGK